MAGAGDKAASTSSNGALNVAALRRIFTHVDGNSDGVLSQRQLLCVVNEVGESTTSSELAALTRSIQGRDDDDEIFTFADTVALVKTRRLQRLFGSIDVDGDGRVDAGELRRHLTSLGADVDGRTVSAMLDAADADGSRSVEFSEFYKLFASHAGDDVTQLSRLWMSMATADTGSDFSAVPPPKAIALPMFVLAGGLGGVVSRTATAPLERLKILAQASKEHTSVRTLMADVLKREGWRGLFAGNGANVVRVFPFGGIVCLSYTHMIKAFPTDNEFDAMEPFYRGIAGALAGAAATTLTYPLDVVKARLSAADQGKYRGGVLGTLRTIVAQEGTRALFKGYFPTLFAIAPFLALQQSSYDVMKQLSAPYVEPSLPLFAALGGVAGVVAQSVIHPVDVVRRRMQLATAPGGGAVAVARAMLAGGGLRGAFAGWTAATAKVVPAVAISLAVRDGVLGRHKQ